MGKYFLGVDVGTGGSRALIIDADGEVVSSAFCDHRPFVSPQVGWAEQDPHDWWRATQSAILKSITQAELRSDEIAAVGLAGQMHGAVLLDENDEPVRPALIWCDQRTQPQCQELEDRFGRGRIIAWTSNPPLTNFTLTKLLWVRENEPSAWDRFRRLLLPKDYVRFRLTGEHAIDVAEASGTLMLDVARRRWASEFLAKVGIAQNCLPRLFESQEICGRVSEPGAAATGLAVGTPVVAGAGDQAAGAVGMGIVRPGDVSATIGTSGVVFAATDKPTIDKGGRIHTFCHAIPDRWHVMGVTQAAGLSLRWFRDELARDLDPEIAYAQLTAEAEKTPPGAEGLLWAPYLMGERTPHLDPEARGALVGISAKHTRGHVVRAILEGVAFSLKDTLTIFEELKVPVSSIRLGGGGARSALWRQIQADVYGQPVEVLQGIEGAALGAALLAGVGAGNWESVDHACEVAVRISQKVLPAHPTSEYMQERYSAYRDLYPRLKGIGDLAVTNEPSCHRL